MNVLILGSTGILGNTLNIFLKKKKINLFSISRKKTNNNNLYLKDFKNFKKLEKDY
jgi:NAD dependent epimerase/dehydratase family enzyme